MNDTMPTQQTHCSLCGASADSVDHFVESDQGAICGDCVINASALIDDDNLSKSIGPVFRLGILLRLLVEPNSGLADSAQQKLIDMVLALREDDFDVYNRLMEELMRLDAPVALLQVMDKVDRIDWTDDETINWMWAKIENGEFQEVSLMPADLREFASDISLFAYHHNILSAKVEILEDQRELENAIDNVDEIIQQTKDSGLLDPNDNYFLGPSESLKARILYKLGRFSEAQKHIEFCEQLKFWSAFTALTAGEVASELGQRDVSAQYWSDGLSRTNSPYFIALFESRLATLVTH